MEVLITYLLKVSIAIALFYGLHMLLFRNETFLKLRRIYFLLALTFSLSFPFMTLNWTVSDKRELPLPAYLMSEIEIFVGGQNTISSPSDMEQTFTFGGVLIGLAALGTSFLLIRFLIQLGGLVAQLKKMKTKKYNGYNIVAIDRTTIPSFSFFHWIVINTSNATDAQIQDIICHEEGHAKQLHSIDVILYEIFCILLWWNPFVWLLKNEMKLNLEYLADDVVQEDKEDKKDYQYTLLQISTANTGVAFINNFNVSHLKKRITMMNKKRSSIVWSGKYLMVLPLLLALVLGNVACTAPASESKKDNAVVVEKEVEQSVAVVETPKEQENVYTIVEQMPKFPGGEKAMMEYIRNNLKYPVDAFEAGIQGRVTIRFVVQKNGSISDVDVIQGIAPSCDNEALRVVKSMPNWEPGKQKGEAVPVYFTLPILFRLK